MNEIVIEDLLKEDKEIVRKLLIDSYKQYEQGFYSPEAWNDYIEQIKLSVDNPNIDRILVAKSNRKIIGTLQIFHSSGEAYNRPELNISSPIVRLLAVQPEARGKGVAQLLLKTSLEYAKSKGAGSLYLHSSDLMQKAIDLYQWLGFKRDESKEFYNRDVLVKCFRFDIKEGVVNL